MAGSDMRRSLELLLLSTLARGSASGYGLATRTGSEEPAVYEALRRLERDRLVRRTARQRQVYRLTRRGKRLRDGELREWRLLARAVAAANAA